MRGRPIRARTFWLFVLAGALLLLIAAVVGPRAWVARRVSRGREALAVRDFERARELLRLAEKTARPEAEIQFLLARTERHLNNFQAAQRHLSRAEQLGFAAERVRLEEILIFAQAGHLDHAEQHLSRLLEEAGDELPEICEAFVAGYFRHLQYESADRLLNTWQSRHADDPQPHLLRASMWEHREEWANAEREARRVLELVPDHRAARFALASVLYRQNRFQEAADEYRRCLDEAPENTNALSGRADCLFKLGENEQAQDVFQRVLEKEPNHFGALLGLGRLELLNGRPEEALVWLKLAAEKKPYDLAARYNLARALKASGRNDAARKHFDYVTKAQAKLERSALLMDTVAREPDNLAARYELGVIVLEHFEPARGLFWLESVLKLDPHHGPTHRVLADYFARLGAQQQAAYHRRLARRAEERRNAP